MTMTKEVKKWIAILSCALAALILFGALAKVPVGDVGAAGSTYVCPHSVVDWATDGTEDVELVKEDGQKVRLATYECAACHEKITIEQPIDAVLDNLPVDSGGAPTFVGNWSFGFTDKDTLAFTPYNSFHENWMCYDGQPWFGGNGAVSAKTGVIGIHPTCTSYVSFCYTAPKDGVISWYVADYNVIGSETAFPEAIVVMSGERVVEFSTPIKPDKDYFYEYFNNIQREVKAGDQVLFCFGANTYTLFDNADALWVDVAVSYMSDLPFEVNEYDADRFGNCSHASYNWTSDGMDYEIFTAENGDKYRICTFKCDYCPRYVTVEQKCDMSYDHFPTVDSDGELVNGSGNWSFGFTSRYTLEFTEYNTVVDGWATYNGEKFYGEHGGIQLDTGYAGIGPDAVAGENLPTYRYTAPRDGVITWHMPDYEGCYIGVLDESYLIPLVMVWDTNGNLLTYSFPAGFDDGDGSTDVYMKFNNMQLTVCEGDRVIFAWRAVGEEITPEMIINDARANISISYMPEDMNVREYDWTDIS